MRAAVGVKGKAGVSAALALAALVDHLAGPLAGVLIGEDERVVLRGAISQAPSNLGAAIIGGPKMPARADRQARPVALVIAGIADILLRPAVAQRAKVGLAGLHKKLGIAFARIIEKYARQIIVRVHLHAQPTRSRLTEEANRLKLIVGIGASDPDAQLRRAGIGRLNRIIIGNNRAILGVDGDGIIIARPRSHIDRAGAPPANFLHQLEVCTLSIIALQSSGVHIFIGDKGRPIRVKRQRRPITDDLAIITRGLPGGSLRTGHNRGLKRPILRGVSPKKSTSLPPQYGGISSASPVMVLI